MKVYFILYLMLPSFSYALSAHPVMQESGTDHYRHARILIIQKLLEVEDNPLYPTSVGTLAGANKTWAHAIDQYYSPESKEALREYRPYSGINYECMSKNESLFKQFVQKSINDKGTLTLCLKRFLQKLGSADYIIHYLVHYKNTQLIKKLIMLTDFKPQLILAILSQSPETITLITSETNINAQDIYGRSTLHLAVHNDLPQIVSLLLEHGANVYLRNKWGQMPRDIAIEKNQTDVVALLDSPQFNDLQSSIKRLKLG